MTAPMQPVAPREESPAAMVARAHAAGYSRDQIADNLERLAQKRSDPTIANYAAEIRKASGQTGSFGAGMGRGMFTKAGDAMMAGVGTAVQKLSGDKRTVGDIYDALKADYTSRTDMDIQDNPTTALAGQVAGGLAASAAVPLKVPGVSVAGPGGRMLNSALTAGGVNAATGALNAPDGERFNAGLESGGAGFLAGGAFSGAADLVKGAARMGPALFRGAANPAIPAGPSTGLMATAKNALMGAPSAARNAVSEATGGAVAPVEEAVPGGARRIIARLNSQGKTVADAEKALTPGPNMLGEDMGARGVRDIRTQRTMGYNAPDEIEATLQTRAEGEAGRAKAALSNAVGQPVDDVVYANERLATARANSRPEYQKFRDMGELADDRLIEPLDKLNTTIQKLGIGKSVLGEVEALADLDGVASPANLFDADGKLVRLPTATEADWIKKALDPIIYGSEQAAKTGLQSPQTFAGARLDLLKQAQKNFVQAVDDVSGGQYAKARAEFAGPMAERTAFMDAQKAAKGISDTDDPARILAQSNNPDATASGTANYLHDELGKVSDGFGGASVQNPAQRMGGGSKRNQLMVAAKGDVSKVEGFETALRDISKRLATRATVMGGSQTAEKGIDIAEQMTDPQFVGAAITKPVDTALKFMADQYFALGRRATGRELDDMAKYSLAGADGQMSKADAIAALKRFEPILQRAWAKQTTRAAGMGAAAGRAITDR